MKRKCILLLILIVLTIQVSLVKYKFTDNLEKIVSRTLSLNDKIMKPLFSQGSNESDISKKVSIIFLSELQIPKKSTVKKEKANKSVDKQKK